MSIKRYVKIISTNNNRYPFDQVGRIFEVLKYGHDHKGKLSWFITMYPPRRHILTSTHILENDAWLYGGSWEFLPAAFVPTNNDVIYKNGTRHE